ncbi:MAG TPA: hypothetical protein VFS40_10635 [Gemmatimonadales bacterium]|nr:hypothetical protein [Gemmatimonadales bacterium]
MRYIAAALAAALAGTALVGGCKPRPVQEQQLPKVSDVFSTLVLPPNGVFVSRQGSSDALQLTFRSPLPAEQVVSYYRSVLGKDPYVLVSDTKGSDGAVSFYAEDKGRPLWIQVVPGALGDSSTVQMAGVVAKASSATADSLRAASTADKIRLDSRRPADSAAQH